MQWVKNFIWTQDGFACGGASQRFGFSAHHFAYDLFVEPLLFMLGIDILRNCPIHCDLLHNMTKAKWNKSTDPDEPKSYDLATVLPSGAVEWKVELNFCGVYSILRIFPIPQEFPRRSLHENP
jgi:hypothetical protein